MKAKTLGLKIPFHRAALGEDEANAVAEVVKSGWLTHGPKTIEFERQFARYVGACHAIAVSSCTAALHLALEAIGLHAGEEVLIPTTTFTATAEVVTYFGARPVLVDVDARTMNLDPRDAEKRITPRARAIIPVHLAGLPCEMDEIASLAARHGLRVIEDAAHALPSEYDGRRVGSLSELTAFSFYITKPLTTGEGGMVTTENEEMAERIRLMRLHGISQDAWKRYSAEGSWFYEVLAAGFKYNMTDLQAAMGLVQLAKCDKLYDARCRIAGVYSTAFSTEPTLEVPAVPSRARSSWHLYILRLHLERLRIDRQEFVKELNERGIGTSVHFIPLHLQPFYQTAFGYREGDLPQAEREYQRCLSLPIYPGMTDDEVQYVVDTVKNVTRSHEK